jgi:2-(1,2-epoxy-1,2-dihydrophenyl)acetyl-CoA isomerase
METSMISLERDECIARITLNRPAAHNALDIEGIAQLADISTKLAEDRTLRAVMIIGTGDKAFCAGGDVATFARQAGHEAELLGDMTHPLNIAISNLMRLDAPIVAAVNGVAAGVGLSLVALADIAIAADHARFHSAYTKIGYTPDGGSSWLLPRLIGRRRAMELYLTARSLNADEALEWGLITQVVRPEALAPTVEAQLRMLTQGPTRCFGAVKRLMLASGSNTLDQQLELEAHTIIAQSQTVEGREGVRAFVEKRPPVFQSD